MLDIDPLRDGAPTKPAATVVLLRDAAPGMQVFLVQRARGAAFMGGAYVFPGGKLDLEDSSDALLSRCAGIDRDRAREALDERGATDPSEALGLYVAALRETFEEAGGPRAYFGRPAEATAAEGRATVATLGAILTESVEQALA